MSNASKEYMGGVMSLTRFQNDGEIVSSTVEWLCCSNVASLLKEDEFNYTFAALATRGAAFMAASNKDPVPTRGGGEG